MTVVAPTPPTKPTPPVLTPTGSHLGMDSSTTTAPANSTQSSNNSASSEVAGAAKKVGEIGKALQGNQAQSKDGAKEASDTAAKASSKQAIPVASTDSQDAITTQTTTAVKSPVINSKPTSLSYAPFVGIVVVVAVVLVGLRLFKDKAKEPRTLIDYSARTSTVMSKEGIDIAVSTQTTNNKVKNNFEVRI
ncbi:MAG: hypothetical protein H6Q70_1085 [Firmicutes bacterium]|nr:hypothetical protein [Bacillota bacterium]